MQWKSKSTHESGVDLDSLVSNLLAGDEDEESLNKKHVQKRRDSHVRRRSLRSESKSASGKSLRR